MDNMLEKLNMAMDRAIADGDYQAQERIAKEIIELGGNC